VFSFFQQSPMIIGYPMEHFGASGRFSSYEAADLPGQDCNCCCSMGSGSAHLSATLVDLHPGQHSTRAGSTLWPHSLLHHDYRRTCNFFSLAPVAGYCSLQGYYPSGSARQGDTWITCGTASMYKLMPDSSGLWAMPWACSL